MSVSPAGVRPTASTGSLEGVGDTIAQLREEKRRRRAAELEAIRRQLEEDERRASEQRRAKIVEMNKRSEEIQQRLDARPGSSCGRSPTPGAGAADAAADPELVRELRERIAELENAARGATELQLGLTERNNALGRQVDELRAALALYQGAEPSKKKVSRTPEARVAEMPAAVAPLRVPGAGDRVMCHFSDWEYLCGVVVREDGPERWLVRLDSEEESPVRKDHVYPPFDECLRVMRECVASEAALRQRHAEAEAALSAQVAGLVEELRAAKADAADLRSVYGIDVRAVEPRAATTPALELLRAYRSEAGVACHVSSAVESVEEYKRGQRRWFTANGGRGDLWGQLSDRVEDVTLPPPTTRGLRARLFMLYVDECADLEVAEVRALSERDLDPSRVYVLDTFSEIFVYVGSRASAEAELQATHAALGVVKHSGERAPLTPVTTVNEGSEPLRFRMWFKDWREREPAEQEQQRVEALRPQTFSYEELVAREGLPPTVDRECLDDYLAEDAFEQVFGMRRSQFVTLPEWKRNEMRRLKKLF
eukprot:m51a1_g12506 hypothetical protein (540) ;mRNA; r:2706-4325